MNRPQQPQPSQSPQPPVKLPMLLVLPTQADLGRLLKEAQQYRGVTVQLPWLEERRDISYTLNCTLHPMGGDPEWVLTQGLTHPVIVWTHVTGDIELILNLVLMQCAPSGANQVNQSASIANINEILKAELERLGHNPLPLGGKSGPSPAAGVPAQLFTTQSRVPAVSSSSLQGNLSEMQVSGLLQSISINKMTGKLVVRQELDSVQVFFEEGQPLHASTSQMVGDAALMEMLTWEVGTFSFSPGERTAERSIKRRFEGLLIEGAALLDQQNFLAKKGLKLGSYLFRKYSNLTEQQFEAALAEAPPIDMAVQKRFYQQVDNKNTLAEILRRFPLQKTDYIPILFNMVSSTLVEVSDIPSLAGRQANLEEIGIDPALVTASFKAICRAESGMLSFPLFLHFLEHEYLRFESTRLPFTLVVFEVAAIRENGSLDALTGPALKEFGECLDQVKRAVDLIGHFRTFEFGLVLPNTDIAGAMVFCNRLMEAVRGATIGGVNGRSLALAFGISGVPEDCQNLGLMLSAAVDAKEQAKEMGAPVVAFRSLYKQV
jgi:GGDEF domain-containing protein